MMSTTNNSGNHNSSSSSASYNSIIPCAARAAVKRIDSKSVFANVARRVRNECAALCLLPTHDYYVKKNNALTVMANENDPDDGKKDTFGAKDPNNNSDSNNIGSAVQLQLRQPVNTAVISNSHKRKRAETDDEKEPQTLNAVPMSTSANTTTASATAREKKSQSEWLRCAVSLVFSSLNLESPNPVGWETEDFDFHHSDNRTHSMDTGGEKDDEGHNSSAAEIATTNVSAAATTSLTTGGGTGGGNGPYWFKGVYPKLHGPQPWQCTRPFIIKTIYNLLLAERVADWLISNERWDALEFVIRPIIVANLLFWKPDIFNLEGRAKTASTRRRRRRRNGERIGDDAGCDDDALLITVYSKKIWEVFKRDQLQSITDCEEALVPPQIGFDYVCRLAFELGLEESIFGDDVGDDTVVDKGEKTTTRREIDSTFTKVISKSHSTEVVTSSGDNEAVVTTTKASAGAATTSSSGGGGENNIFSGDNVVLKQMWKCDYCSAAFSVYDEAVSHEIKCKDKSQEEDDEEELKVWKCDYCPAAFSVYDEAVSHEIECKDNSQEERDNVVLKRMWKCDYCSASFSVYDKAVSHEIKCKNKSQKEGEEETVYKCDYCSAAFSVYDEAVSHEIECKDKSQEEREEEEEGETLYKCDYCSAAFSVHDEAVSHEIKCKDKVQGEEEGEEETVYRCDYCSAEFSVYDEALSHEIECRDKSQEEEEEGGELDGDDEVVVEVVVTGQLNDTDFANHGVGEVVQEEWKCDYCSSFFPSHDEAASHEIVCKAKISESTVTAFSADSITLKEVLRSRLLKTIKELHYEYFPLMSGEEEKLVEVRDQVWKCMHAITPITNEKEVASKKRVESVLNHLEYHLGYLSALNEIFRVRIDAKALMDESLSESPKKIVRLMSLESENDPEAVVVTYGLNSNGDQVVMAAKSPRSENMASPQITHTALSRSIPVSIHVDNRQQCGQCILCNAPNCELCFACRSKEVKRFCIRKSCCKIPFENKAMFLDKLGFPSGWQFAFCDPIMSALVKSPRRILSMAGLVLCRPLSFARYQYFHSFEDAFLTVQHKDVSEATKLVDCFFWHVHGSKAMRSHSSHFLIGRRVCFAFTSVDGRNVVLFGSISKYFRESSDDGDSIFMVRFDSDCLNVAAESLGVYVRPLQLISSQLAWGGCISFERKAFIHGRKSAVRSIDQAAAVEYWVTPDMRMETMVEQGNGEVLPQLTLVLRGHKFVFTVNKYREGYRVSVSCTSTNGERNKEESILRPGELIDLGVFCPLLDSDSKPLAVFLLKNYLHNFTINSYSGDGNGYVHDLTDDGTGMLHAAARRKVLSYVRSCNENDIPTIHDGLDPSGKVHLLFGVRYRGDWQEYTSTMQERILPIIRGEQKEVNFAPNSMTNKNQELTYLSAIENFGPDDLLHCANFLATLTRGGSASMVSAQTRERSILLATSLRDRIAELKGIPSMHQADQLLLNTVDQIKSRQQISQRYLMPPNAAAFF